MNTITPKQLEKAGKELSLFTKSAKRKLFEFETMMSAYEIRKGRADTFKSAKELIKKVH